MEYEFYPEALENVIRKVAQDFKGTLIVTENGLATSGDQAEGHGIAFLPFEVVEQAPVHITFYGDAIGDAGWRIRKLPQKNG